MPNRNELIIELLTDAIVQLESCEEVLDEAKAVTAPITRIAKLTAAIDFHEEALFALKDAKFTYNDGELIVNEKLTFDFYKTAAETAVVGVMPLSLKSMTFSIR